MESKRHSFRLFFFGILSLLLFIWIAESVYAGRFLTKMDLPILNFLQSFQTVFLGKVMKSISFLGDGKLLIPACVIAIFLFILKREFWLAAHFSALIVISVLLTKTFKWLIHAKRPEIAQSFVPASDFYKSFPSGHVSLSLVVYGFCAFLIASTLTDKNRKISYWVAGVLIFCIALSRVYLGAHWLSDIMGAVFFSLACVLFTIASYQRRLVTTPINAQEVRNSA